MTARPAAANRRLVRVLVWLVGLLLVATLAAAIIHILQRDRHAEDVEPPAPVAAKPRDFDAYERANAEQTRERVARDDAAQDAYRADHPAKDEPALRRLPDERAP